MSNIESCTYIIGDLKAKQDDILSWINRLTTCKNVQKNPEKYWWDLKKIFPYFWFKTLEKILKIKIWKITQDKFEEKSEKFSSKIGFPEAESFFPTMLVVKWETTILLEDGEEPRTIQWVQLWIASTMPFQNETSFCSDEMAVFNWYFCTKLSSAFWAKYLCFVGFPIWE